MIDQYLSIHAINISLIIPIFLFVPSDVNTDSVSQKLSFLVIGNIKMKTTCVNDKKVNHEAEMATDGRMDEAQTFVIT